MAETVTVNFAQLHEMLDELGKGVADAARAMPVVAEALHSLTLEVFEQEGAVDNNPRWPELSESTLRKRRKSASPKMLQDTAVLIGSLTPDSGDAFAEVFTNVPYAVFHVSKAPRRVIPLRDFFAVDMEAFQAEAADIIAAALLGQI